MIKPTWKWQRYSRRVNDMKKKIIVVGAGAAGLMAAGRAAEKGHEVHLYEKNNRIGKMQAIRNMWITIMIWSGIWVVVRIFCGM